MALQKAIASEYGFDATYWKVRSIQIYYEDGGILVDVVLLGFLDKDARTAGKKSFMTAQKRIEGMASDFTRADLYAEIKKIEDFVGSTDV